VVKDDGVDNFLVNGNNDLVEDDNAWEEDRG